MKKIFYTMLLACIFFYTIPVLACGQQEKGTMTGAACSISELNNLGKSKTATKNLNPYQERNLRPVKFIFEMSKSDNDCLLGTCLYKKLINDINK